MSTKQLLIALSFGVLSAVFAGCSNQPAQTTETNNPHPGQAVLPASPPEAGSELAEAQEQLKHIYADNLFSPPAWRAELEGRKEAHDLQALRDSFHRIDNFLTRWEYKVEMERLSTSTEELKRVRRDRAIAYVSAVTASLKADVRGIYSPNAVRELEEAIKALENAGLSPQDADENLTADDLRQLLKREAKRYIEAEGLAPDPEGGITDAGGLILGFMVSYNFTPQDLGFGGKEAELLQAARERYYSGEGGH